jgi:glycerophosphoryl diester phosphodiesterase
VHVWPVDDPAVMAGLLDAGADGIITDRPDVLRELLRSRGTWS